jgi:hypothetical protein
MDEVLLNFKKKIYKTGLFFLQSGIGLVERLGIRIK